MVQVQWPTRLANTEGQAASSNIKASVAKTSSENFFVWTPPPHFFIDFCLF